MDQKLADQIDDFKAWALKLGCPVSALPNDLVLNRLMKTNGANLQKLMTHVRPKAEVKLIRDNLLLNSLSNSNVLSERQLSQLPQNFKNIKKGEKLNRQINELKPRAEELKAVVKGKQLSLSKKGKLLLCHSLVKLWFIDQSS